MWSKGPSDRFVRISGCRDRRQRKPKTHEKMVLTCYVEVVEVVRGMVRRGIHRERLRPLDHLEPPFGEPAELSFPGISPIRGIGEDGKRDVAPGTSVFKVEVYEVPHEVVEHGPEVVDVVGEEKANVGRHRRHFEENKRAPWVVDLEIQGVVGGGDEGVDRRFKLGRLACCPSKLEPDALQTLSRFYLDTHGPLHPADRDEYRTCRSMQLPCHRARLSEVSALLCKCPIPPALCATPTYLASIPDDNLIECHPGSSANTRWRSGPLQSELALTWGLAIASAVSPETRLGV